jgi:hypothetical protein
MPNDAFVLTSTTVPILLPNPVNLVRTLDNLPPANYVVFGKATLWAPHLQTFATVILDANPNGQDTTEVNLAPSGQGGSYETVCLILGLKVPSGQTGKVDLIIRSALGNIVAAQNIRIAAMQVDDLKIIETGPPELVVRVDFDINS